MDWTNFGIVATFLWALQLTAYFAWLAGFPSPPRAAEESRAWRRPSAARKVNAIVFLIFAMIATVEAQKSGPANSPPPRACAPRRTAPARTATVGEDDIMRGYVLESETVDDGFSFSMPSNAITVGTWHIHGAASPFGRNTVDFGDFSFPLGPDHARFSRFWYSLNASLRTVPHDSSRQIRAADQSLFASAGASRLWRMDHAGARTICWESLFDMTDTNTPVNAAITLFLNGDFQTRSNSLVRTYRRINPDDWDGDGLPNPLDAEPDVFNGDLYGTSAAWYNAACGNVLGAQSDTNGEVSISWNTNACEDAYFWLSFTSGDGPNRVDITCDGPSNLGDMTLIAVSNQSCRVPLLMGAHYHVLAQFDLLDIAVSDSAAETTFAFAEPVLRTIRSLPRRSGPSGSRDFWVIRPVDLNITGSSPDFSLVTDPYVGASLASVTGGCCNMQPNETNLSWNCEQSCDCSGFSHLITAAATWEGYTRQFAMEMSCDCQKQNANNPNTWFRITGPDILIKDGNTHDVSACLEAPAGTDASITISCTAGSDRIQIVGGGASSFTVRGTSKSAAVGDVVFEAQLVLDGTVYRKEHTLTVAEVKCLHMTSDVAAGSVSPPPFDGGVENPFTPYAPGSPGKHLLVPFNLVVNTDDFSINDFSVDMRLELDPDVGESSGLSVVWTKEEDTVESGTFTPLGGMSARFANPKRGGFIRFSARCDGSPATKGTLLLPLAGAAVDGVFLEDFMASRTAGRHFASSWTRYLFTPFWGVWWFFIDANGDYIGRVDSAARPTVWRYNDIDDDTGLGAIATLHGLPVRMAKLSNFLVSTTLTSLEVNEMLRRMAAHIGSNDDPAAGISWSAGTDVATNGNFIAATAAMSTNIWRVADEEVITLWPNTAPADNHAPRSRTMDLNRVFCSPGFIDKCGRQTRPAQ